MPTGWEYFLLLTCASPRARSSCWFISTTWLDVGWPFSPKMASMDSPALLFRRSCARSISSVNEVPGTNTSRYSHGRANPSGCEDASESLKKRSTPVRLFNQNGTKNVTRDTLLKSLSASDVCMRTLRIAGAAILLSSADDPWDSSLLSDSTSTFSGGGRNATYSGVCTPRLEEGSGDIPGASWYGEAGTPPSLNGVISAADTSTWRSTTASSAPPPVEDGESSVAPGDRGGVVAASPLPNKRRSRPFLLFFLTPESFVAGTNLTVFVRVSSKTGLSTKLLGGDEAGMSCGWGGIGLAEVGGARLTVCGGADAALALLDLLVLLLPLRLAIDLILATWRLTSRAVTAFRAFRFSCAWTDRSLDRPIFSRSRYCSMPNASVGSSRPTSSMRSGIAAGNRSSRSLRCTLGVHDGLQRVHLVVRMFTSSNDTWAKMSLLTSA